MTARDLALYELDQCRLPGWKPDLLRRRAQGGVTNGRDFALAEHIIVGVIKNHLLLQHLSEHHSGRRLKSIDPLVQKILSIGLYQLQCLDRIPASAAVNEAVDQAKRFGRTKAAGFVNAVLRKASAVGPHRVDDPIRLSHPPELFTRLVKLLGHADAVRFCEHDNAEPPTIVRLLPGVTPAQLESPGVTITPQERAGMFVVSPAKKPLLAEWSSKNLAQVQDPTAAGVVERLPIEPGQSVLDRCAGLGTKTLQLRAKVGDAGTVVAVDPAADRCRALSAILKRRGISNVTVHQTAMLAGIPEFADRQFDVALLDVPCSNSGVLARRAEARYAQGNEALASLSKLQRSILDDTADHVRPGGILVYSTCSVWPEENRGQVDAFLKRHSEYQFERDETTLPSFEPDATTYHDGGYWAVLKRVIEKN